MYPWNSSELQLDLDDDLIQAAFEKVATEMIFTETGRRFYDYLRGRHDAVTIPTEDNRMPDPDKDPGAVTEWVKSEFEPKDLIQFSSQNHCLGLLLSSSMMTCRGILRKKSHRRLSIRR